MNAQHASLSGAAVLAQDLGNEQQGLLEAIDKLRFARLENIKLPQIVVVGDQSAGKSSVLESLTGVPFPRDAEACTRFATEIRLRRSNEERFSIRIWPDIRDRTRTAQDIERLKRFGENVSSSTSFDTLMRAAVREIWPKNIPGRFASRDILRVELSGPQMPLLTLVDLPGLVKNANKDQSGEDIQAINDIADEYMKSSRTIILAVVGGNNDFVHQTVLNRARQFDPDGSRTIGVLTKPDLTGTIGLEDKFIALVNNEDSLNRFKLGWYVLLNPGPTETWLSREQRQQKEDEFFSRGKWSTLPRSMCGASSLKKKLTEQLQHHISRHVPKLLKEIDQQLHATESELEALGRGRDTVPEMREELAELCSASEKLVTLAVKGSYDDPSFFPSGVDERGTPPQKLRARVVDENERFAKKVRMLGRKGTLSDSQAKKDYARKKVEPLLRQNRGTAFLGDSDPRLVYQLFQDYSSEWPKLAQEHRAKLGVICAEFLGEIIGFVWPRRMQHPLRAVLVNEQIQERLKNADKEVETLRQDQHLYVQSYDPEYLERLEAWRTKVTTDGAQPSLAEEYLEKMLIHYELTARTFTSNVITQVIERHLLQGFPEVFSALKVIRLDDEKVRAIAEDDPGTRNKRVMLKEQRQAIIEGRTYLETIALSRELRTYGSEERGGEESSDEEVPQSRSQPSRGRESTQSGSSAAEPPIPVINNPVMAGNWDPSAAGFNSPIPSAPEMPPRPSKNPTYSIPQSTPAATPARPLSTSSQQYSGYDSQQNRYYPPPSTPPGPNRQTPTPYTNPADLYPTGTLDPEGWEQYQVPQTNGSPYPPAAAESPAPSGRRERSDGLLRLGKSLRRNNA
ncbi:MAG: hypothetical protein M1839_000575 [Geoglossum umbratile]|nr:MAG: hypothetical protein M1839_000575 [Geoglossum umbratile]